MVTYVYSFGRRVTQYVVPTTLSRQLIQQRLGLLEVPRVKAFGEPMVDRGEQVVRFLALALPLPQPGQAHGGPQLPRLGLLAAGHGEGLLEAGFESREMLGETVKVR